MNSIKNIWSQFKRFVRFDQSTFIQISNDRYETGNALVVVLFSLLFIYIPLFINFSAVNISNIIFDGIFSWLIDGIFSWLIANLAIWFLLSRAFNQQIETNSLLVFTGYTHGLLGFLGIVLLTDSLNMIPAIFLQITTITIFAWMYFVLSKSLRSAFLLEDKVASITTVTFLFVLILFSDPIRIPIRIYF